jgi:hypothetical protein
MQMPVDHAFGIVENGVERFRIAGDVGETDLAAEFQPDEVNEGKADGTLQFAGFFEDEAAIGGNDHA